MYLYYCFKLATRSTSIFILTTPKVWSRTTVVELKKLLKKTYLLIKIQVQAWLRETVMLKMYAKSAEVLRLVRRQSWVSVTNTLLMCPVFRTESASIMLVFGNCLVRGSRTAVVWLRQTRRDIFKAVSPSANTSITCKRTYCTQDWCTDDTVGLTVPQLCWGHTFVHLLDTTAWYSQYPKH